MQQEQTTTNSDYSPPSSSQISKDERSGVEPISTLFGSSEPQKEVEMHIIWDWILKRPLIQRNLEGIDLFIIPSKYYSKDNTVNSIYKYIPKDSYYWNAISSNPARRKILDECVISKRTAICVVTFSHSPRNGSEGGGDITEIFDLRLPRVVE